MDEKLRAIVERDVLQEKRKESVERGKQEAGRYEGKPKKHLQEFGPI